MIYQVVLIDKNQKRVWHVAYFEMQECAIDCMSKIGDLHSDKTVQVWSNILFESRWDGNFNVYEEFHLD